MRRQSFADMSCSIARTLEWVGEWWTLLIVREAFYGSRRFAEFQAALGIATNVLSERLARLVEGGILTVAAHPEDARMLEYRLTSKGKDLFPVLLALSQWGDRHAAGPKGPPVRIVERSTGRKLAPLVPRSTSGRELSAADIGVLPGPGATAQERERIAGILERGSASNRSSRPPAVRSARATGRR